MHYIKHWVPISRFLPAVMPLSPNPLLSNGGADDIFRVSMHGMGGQYQILSVRLAIPPEIAGRMVGSNPAYALLMFLAVSRWDLV